MNAILICPGERENVLALAEGVPLCNQVVCGKSVIEYWIESLATKGVRRILVLATDRPEQVRSLVGDGSRWGLEIEVNPEIRELSVEEARYKYANALENPSAEIVLMETLPGLPEFPLFRSYVGWHAALMEWMPRAATPDRIGVREIQPGVWVGLRTRLAPTARIQAPCWIGDDVEVGADASIGPRVVIENRVVIEAGAEVVDGEVGPETVVGRLTELRSSLAFGETLVSYKLDSCTKISDPFLLCGLSPRRSIFKRAGFGARLVALLVLVLTSPFAALAMGRSKIHGRGVFRPMLGMRPRLSGIAAIPGDTFIYYELAGTRGWLRRWPQLWSVVRGNLVWIGNRPLHPRQAARLMNDFERLWLSAPVGLISLADAEGSTDFFSDQTRAHSSYYSAQASRFLDAIIFLRSLFLFVFGIPYTRARDQVTKAFGAFQAQERRAHS